MSFYLTETREPSGGLHPAPSGQRIFMEETSKQSLKPSLDLQASEVEVGGFLMCREQHVQAQSQKIAK